MKMSYIGYRQIENYFYNLFLSLKYQQKIKGFINTRIDKIDLKYKNDIRNYWGNYKHRININWHKWYSSRNNIRDVRFIPEYVYYCDIEPFFNNLEVVKAYSDKAFLNILFPEIKRPPTIAKNMSGVFYDEVFNQITIDEVIQRCCLEQSYVIKPTMKSGGGKNVKFISNSGDYDNDRKNVAKFIEDYQSNFIIQEIIEQHFELNRINPESINTIRTISFFYKEEVHILSSVLRMGINHSRVDNQSVGGISTGINLNGKTSKFAYDKLGNSLIQHPQGILIKDIKIPGYEELISVIKKAHTRVGHCKIISWDFAVDENASPVLIEINLRGQGINLHQINNGPLFRELTTKVLDEVYRKN